MPNPSYMVDEENLSLSFYEALSLTAADWQKYRRGEVALTCRKTRT